MRRNFFLILLFLILLSLLLDTYVWRGLKVIQEGRSLKEVFWTVSIFVTGLFAYAFYRVIPTRKITPFFNGVLNVFLALLVSKLVFAAVLLIGDIFRLPIAAINYFSNSNSEVMPARFKQVSYIASALALVTLGYFLFGITRGKYHYKVHRKVIYFKELPEEFDGFTITQISDIHSGSFDNKFAVERGINLINAQKSDLFVFTGDMVNNKAEEISPYIDIFKKIEAPFGKFSILGNHDYGDYVSWNSIEEKQHNLNKLKGYHKEINFRLLLDESVSIKKNGQEIILAGVENWGLGFGQRGNLKKALAKVHPASFKILLSHDPSHLDAEVKNNPMRIDISLAGHTHGMQFGFEAFGFKWSPVKYRYKNWAGLFEENGRYLYVNRGFGFIGFSGRVGIWPEITVLELKRAI